MNSAALELTESPPRESAAFLTSQLITCLGNKRSLLPHLLRAIQTVCQRLNKEKLVSADLFSGSGSVARALKQFSSRLIVNDQELYSTILNQCYLADPSPEKIAELRALHADLLARIEAEAAPGWLTALYAPRDEAAITKHDRAFYTRRNAIFLDTARRLIEPLPEGDRPFFLAPLLVEASIHANTSGVFKGFYKNKAGIGQFGGEGRNALLRICGAITLPFPLFSATPCHTEIYQRDANQLVRELPPLDLAYLDPPYNQHPYGSNYFMLNLIAENRRPDRISPVSGIPADWNRSAYNRRAEAEEALFSLIAACPARFTLISYNSEGFIDHATFRRRLKDLGTIEHTAIPYNAFRGSRNLANRPLHVSEHLYLLEKHA